jgi:hypothetical protein
MPAKVEANNRVTETMQNSQTREASIYDQDSIDRKSVHQKKVDPFRKCIAAIATILYILYNSLINSILTQ